MRNSTIVLIDDDPIDTFITTTFIKKTGMAKELKSFADPVKALNYLSSAHAPDLIILDMNMPFLDGIQFVKLYRKLKTVKSELVVLSSYNSPEDIARMHEVGISRIVEKPLTEEKINSFFVANQVK